MIRQKWEAYVSAISIYPVKSMRGISLSASVLKKSGLEWDRDWMWVDDADNFITQRTVPGLAGIDLQHEKGNFFVSWANQKLHFPPPDQTGDELIATIWSRKVKCIANLPIISQAVSQYLGKEMRLVRLVKDHKKTHLADSSPLLICSETSLNSLNERLSIDTSMNRFRPNIVLRGIPPFLEDHINELHGPGYTIRVEKKCSRCIIINTDQYSGKRYEEPLRTLGQFRKEGNNIFFGINASVLKEGIIRTGQRLLLKGINKL